MKKKTNALPRVYMGIIFAFLYLFSSYLSIKTKELLYIEAELVKDIQYILKQVDAMRF